jgi:hypothetical protein
MEESKYPVLGYAPGHYQNTCVSCKNLFTGDKLARQCEPCAVRMLYPGAFPVVLYPKLKAEEILGRHVSFRGNISAGNYSCVGIPYSEALSAIKEAISIYHPLPAQNEIKAEEALAEILGKTMDEINDSEPFYLHQGEVIDIMNKYVLKLKQQS